MIEKYETKVITSFSGFHLCISFIFSYLFILNKS
uniref:Uncharacterized protein n=1 Tax=Rhizophora mucronata TaxID=61149 RepID=A0A2P2R0S3_RHIMU